MVVRKIIERILEEGQTSITITDTDIPGSLVRTYSNDPDLMPTQVVLTGSTLKIDYEAQSSDKYVAVELVKQGLDIIDNLESTDTDAALSAKQGKVLKDLVDYITPIRELTELDDVLVTDLTDGDILKYDAENEVFKNYLLPDIPVYLGDLGDIVLNTATRGQVLTYNGAYWTNEDPESGSSDASWSTTERKIGTWYDGSDLYETTVHFSSPTKGTGIRVNHNIPNISKVCNFDYTFIGSDDASYKNTGDDTNTNYWYTVCEVGKTGLRYTCGNNQYITIADLVVKIQYTKTS